MRSIWPYYGLNGQSKQPCRTRLEASHLPEKQEMDIAGVHVLAHYPNSSQPSILETLLFHSHHHLQLMTWGGAREYPGLANNLWTGWGHFSSGRSTSYSRGQWAISRQCCREMGGHGCLAWGRHSFRVTSFTGATGPTHSNKNTIPFLQQRQSTRPAALKRNSECWVTTAISRRFWPQDPFAFLKFGVVGTRDCILGLLCTKHVLYLKLHSP